MTPDIQARLRTVFDNEGYWGDMKALGGAAADEIARLTSDLADLKHDMERLMESTTAEATENVRLTKEVGRLEKQSIGLNDARNEIRREWVAMKNKADALAEALTEILEWIDNYPPDFVCDDKWPDAQDKATTTLAAYQWEALDADL